jgi:hypothetical protein
VGFWIEMYGTGWMILQDPFYRIHASGEALLG